jgi:hypothetical protein
MKKYLLTVQFFTDVTKPGKWYKRVGTLNEHLGVLMVLKSQSSLYEYTSLSLINEDGETVSKHLSSHELTFTDIAAFFERVATSRLSSDR